MLPNTGKAAYSIRRIRLSAWSSETEVSEPAADCGALDRSPRPGRRELRPAGVDYSRESVYVQLRCNPRCGVFQGSSGLSNRGQGEIPSSGEGWAIAMSWPTLPLRTSEVHASIFETSCGEMATRANRRTLRWTADFLKCGPKGPVSRQRRRQTQETQGRLVLVVSCNAT